MIKLLFTSGSSKIGQTSKLMFKDLTKKIGNESNSEEASSAIALLDGGYLRGATQ